MAIFTKHPATIEAFCLDHDVETAWFDMLRTTAPARRRGHANGLLQEGGTLVAALEGEYIVLTGMDEICALPADRFERTWQPS
jgi:hypothetical protein